MRHGNLVVTDLNAFHRVSLGIQRVETRLKNGLHHAPLARLGQLTLRRSARARRYHPHIAGIDFDHLDDTNFIGIRIQPIGAGQKDFALNAALVRAGEKFARRQFPAGLADDDANLASLHDDLVSELALVKERVDEMPARSERFQQHAFLAGVGDDLARRHFLACFRHQDKNFIRWHVRVLDDPNPETFV